MSNDIHPSDGTGIAGHGAFFQPTNLSPEDAAKATAWVEKRVDRRTLDLSERMDAGICAPRSGDSCRYA